MAKLSVVNADGSVTECAAEFAECQKAVGGYVEPVFLSTGDCLLVNEDGLSLGLKPNPRASLLACWSAARLPPSGIVGPAVFVPRELVDAVLNGTPVPLDLEDKKGEHTNG